MGNVVDGLDRLSGFFGVFKGIADDIKASGEGIEVDATKAIDGSYCPGDVDALFASMREFAEFLTSAAVEAGDLVGTFPDAIDDASDILSENAVDRKDLVFYMFWAFIMVNLLLLSLAVLLKSQHFLRFMMLVAMVIVMLLTIVCFIEMIIVVSGTSILLSFSLPLSLIPSHFCEYFFVHAVVILYLFHSILSSSFTLLRSHVITRTLEKMLFGDFCMEPENHILSAVEGITNNDTNAVGIIQYYTLCDSHTVNPINESASNMTVRFQELEEVRVQVGGRAHSAHAHPFTPHLLTASLPHPFCVQNLCKPQNPHR